VRVRLVDDPRAEVGEDVRVGVGAVECQLNHTAELHQLLCMLLVPVAQSSSDGVAIRYVLPVLWLTSCFHTVCCNVMCIRKWQSVRVTTTSVQTKFCEVT